MGRGGPGDLCLSLFRSSHLTQGEEGRSLVPYTCHWLYHQSAGGASRFGRAKDSGEGPQMVCVLSQQLIDTTHTGVAYHVQGGDSEPPMAFVLVRPPKPATVMSITTKAMSDSGRYLPLSFFAR